MPIYHWDAQKDALLQRARGISFRDVVRHIQQGGLLDTIKRPNPLRHPGPRIFIVRHPGPRIFIVRIGNYAYIENCAWRVPFETTETGLFLRTAYPSRESTRDYLQ